MYFWPSLSPSWRERIFVPAILLLCLAVSVPQLAAPQGFSGGIGGGKKKIFLHRKLPAAIKLTTTSFNIVATAREKNQADVAQSLSDILETELLKNDKKLHSEKSGAELLISCTITHFEIPPPVTSTRTEVVLQKGKSVQVPKQYYRLVGALEVAYQAKDAKAGRVIDSQNLTEKYSKEFESGTNESSDKSLPTKMSDPFKRMAGKKTDDDAPPTLIELRQQLIHKIATQIAARLVSTEETVEVLLARGKLDNADKLAESALWSRNLETLETMTPFPDPKQDAYRLYNIGVANEALGYQAEDHATAKKFFEEAAINYGKAIDARPDEKYFLEPQNRIETAVAHYKKLDERQSVAAPPPQKSAPPPTTTADGDAKTLPPTAHTKTKSVSSSSAAKTPATSTTTTATNTATTPAKSSTPPPPALTNQKIVAMVKGGVDEESVIATIHDAPIATFDLTPEGQIDLAKNGVKGKILAAMRDRSHRPNRGASKPSTN